MCSDEGGSRDVREGRQQLQQKGEQLVPGERFGKGSLQVQRASVMARGWMDGFGAKQGRSTSVKVKMGSRWAATRTWDLTAPPQDQHRRTARRQPGPCGGEKKQQILADREPTKALGR